MKPATVHEIKKALATVDPDQLTEMILRLAKFKKDNKELLTYLLFEADDEDAYVSAVKAQMDEYFEDVNHSSIFLTKKTIRKIVRFQTKFIRYSGKKETEIDLRIYFCEKMKSERIPIRRSRVLGNMYASQIKKIKTTMGKLHEDLQYEYEGRLERLTG